MPDENGDRHFTIDMWGYDGTAVAKLHEARSVDICVYRTYSGSSKIRNKMTLRKSDMKLEVMERLIQDIQNFGSAMYLHGQDDKSRKVRDVLGILDPH